MAAQAHTAAGAASEAALPAPVKTEAAGGGGGGAAAAAAGGAPGSAQGADDDDDEAEGAVWETASLFEEILDDVAAFEYSGSSKLRAQCITITTTTRRSLAQTPRHAPPKRPASCASACTRSAPRSSSWRTSPARR
jgi:hypothetical protein